MKRERISWLVGSFNYCFFFSCDWHLLGDFACFFCEVIMICCTAAKYDFRRGTLLSILLLPFPTAYGAGKPMCLAICHLNNVNVFGAGGIQIWRYRKVLTKSKILRRLFWRDKRCSKRSSMFCVSIILFFGPTRLGKNNVFTTDLYFKEGWG